MINLTGNTVNIQPWNTILEYFLNFNQTVITNKYRKNDSIKTSKPKRMNTPESITKKSCSEYHWYIKYIYSQIVQFSVKEVSSDTGRSESAEVSLGARKKIRAFPVNDFSWTEMGKGGGRGKKNKQNPELFNQNKSGIFK